MRENRWKSSAKGDWINCIMDTKKDKEYNLQEIIEILNCYDSNMQLIIEKSAEQSLKIVQLRDENSKLRKTLLECGRN